MCPAGEFAGKARGAKLPVDFGVFPVKTGNSLIAESQNAVKITNQILKYLVDN